LAGLDLRVAAHTASTSGRLRRTRSSVRRTARQVVWRQPGSFSQRKLQQTALRLASENALAKRQRLHAACSAHTSPTPSCNHKQAALYQRRPRVRDAAPGRAGQRAHQRRAVPAPRPCRREDRGGRDAQTRSPSSTACARLRRCRRAWTRRTATARGPSTSSPLRRGAALSPRRWSASAPRSRGWRSCTTARITKASAAAFKKAGPEEAAIGTKVVGQKGVIGVSGPRAERLGAALSVSREKLDRMENARSEPHGADRHRRRRGRTAGGARTSATRRPSRSPLAPSPRRRGRPSGSRARTSRNNEFKVRGASERAACPTTRRTSWRRTCGTLYSFVNTDEFRRGVRQDRLGRQAL
jgi:hypothetical protein